MKSNFACIALGFAMAFATSASAATFNVKTISTEGTYESFPFQVITDTSAYFSFKADYTTLDNVTVYDGVFTDSNRNTTGFATAAYDLGTNGANLFGGTLSLFNNDAANLRITLGNYDGSSMLTGRYDFTGGAGELASGTFTAAVSTVPLPASAPLFGAALVALGAAGHRAKRRKGAAA